MPRAAAPFIRRAEADGRRRRPRDGGNAAPSGRKDGRDRRADRLPLPRDGEPEPIDGGAADQYSEPPDRRHEIHRGRERAEPRTHPPHRGRKTDDFHRRQALRQLRAHLRPARKDVRERGRNEIALRQRRRHQAGLFQRKTPRHLGGSAAQRPARTDARARTVRAKRETQSARQFPRRFRDPFARERR